MQVMHDGRSANIHSAERSLLCVQMMPPDMRSKGVKQYRDLIDGSLADMPLPETPMPSFADDAAEEHQVAAAGVPASVPFCLLAVLLMQISSLLIIVFQYMLIPAHQG